MIGNDKVVVSQKLLEGLKVFRCGYRQDMKIVCFESSCRADCPIWVRAGELAYYKNCQDALKGVG